MSEAVPDDGAACENNGLSRTALGKYTADNFKGISPFSTATLVKFYELSTDYLMGLPEAKITQTQTHDLHLSDEMIPALLKWEGK